MSSVSAILEHRRTAAEATAANAAEVAAQIPTASFRTFVHQVAGANTIMPDGKKLEFLGKTGRAHEGSWQKGGSGYYITDLPLEVQWLEALVKVPTSQVTELINDGDGTEHLLEKPVDRSIAQSVADAAVNTEKVFDPAISAAVNNLPKAIAAGAAADSQIAGE